MSALVVLGLLMVLCVMLGGALMLMWGVSRLD